jgi:hypothetical protein
MSALEEFQTKYRALVAEALAGGAALPVDVEDVDTIIDLFRDLVKRARLNNQHLIAEKLRNAMKTTEVVSSEIVEQEATKQAQGQGNEKVQSEAPRRGARGTVGNGAETGDQRGHL